MRNCCLKLREGIFCTSLHIKYGAITNYRRKACRRREQLAELMTTRGDCLANNSRVRMVFAAESDMRDGEEKFYRVWFFEHACKKSQRLRMF